MKWSARDVERLAADYAAVRPRYVRFTNRLADLVGALVEEMDVKIHTLESRAKTVESFREKITRPEKDYEDPLHEITDLSGVRVILYYSDDVVAVKKMLSAEFHVDEKASADYTQVSQPDKFGYESVHMIVALRADRRASREWASVANLVAAIQVRTVLQHAWAAVSHDLHYKREDRSSDEWSRRLYRMVGMFETADEQFSQLRSERVKAKEGAEEAVEAGNLRIPLNEVSLRQYLQSSETVSALWSAASEHMFKYQARSENEDFTRELLNLSLHAGLQWLDQMDGTLRAGLRHAPTLFEKLTNDEASWWSNEAFAASLVLLFTHREKFTLNDLTTSGWSPAVAERALQAVAATAG